MFTKVVLSACLPCGKLTDMDKMKLETWASYTLRRDVSVQEGADATGYGSRGQYSKRSRTGELPLDRIQAALDHWQEEAAEKGITLNLTDTLVEMGYLPAPTQDFNQASSLTATTTRRKATTAKPQHDLSEYGY